MKKILYTLSFLSLFLVIIFLSPLEIKAQVVPDTVCKVTETNVGCGGSGGGQTCGNTYRGCIDTASGNLICRPDSGCSGSSPSQPGGSVAGQLCPDGGLNTAIGCLSFSSETSLASSFIRWGIGIGGGIAILMIIYAGFIITTSSGDPKRLQGGKEILGAAIGGLILLIFSVFILRLIGVNILGIL
jgi:hypothetical protein